MPDLIERAEAAEAPDAVEDLYEEARLSLERKRAFHVHLAVYLVVNGLIWLGWGILYAYTDVWFPWPLFPLVGWGIGLGFHAWDTYGRRPFTRAQIEREAARLSGGR